MNKEQEYVISTYLKKMKALEKEMFYGSNQQTSSKSFSSSSIPMTTTNGAQVTYTWSEKTLLASTVPWACSKSFLNVIDLLVRAINPEKYPQKELDRMTLDSKVNLIMHYNDGTGHRHPALIRNWYKRALELTY